MNLHHLEIFHAVAAVGNLTLSARLLGTSQPAVTKQLHQLEDSLGVTLFDRQPRGVRLTEAGELLESRARRIFAERERALAELEEWRGLRRGRLRLAASLTVASYLLPAVLEHFHRECGGIEIGLEVVNTRLCLERARAGEVDAALVEGPVDPEGLAVEVFARDELQVVTSPVHPLARRHAAVPLPRLLREPLVSREEGSGTRAVLEAELSRRHLTWASALTVGATEAIKELVAAGAGVAVLSRLAVARDVAGGRLAVLKVRNLELGRDLSVALPEGHGRTPALAAFLTELKTVRE